MLSRTTLGDENEQLGEVYVTRLRCCRPCSLLSDMIKLMTVHHPAFAGVQPPGPAAPEGRQGGRQRGHAAVGRPVPSRLCAGRSGALRWVTPSLVCQSCHDPVMSCCPERIPSASTSHTNSVRQRKLHLQASCPAWRRCCAPSQPSAPTAWWSSATAPQRWTLRATCAGARSGPVLLLQYTSTA